MDVGSSREAALRTLPGYVMAWREKCIAENAPPAVWPLACDLKAPRHATAQCTPAQTRDMSDAAASKPIPTAAESDPQTLGYMQGFPPPNDKLITFQDGSFRSFPELRWAWSNIRQLVPTVNVWRGAGPASDLPRAERDIGASTSTTMDG
eukprot:gene16762-22221_t